MKLEKGHCQLTMLRFYYEISTRTCKKFIYSGCGGNSNNFKTLGECQKVCRPTKNVCEMKVDPGVCKGAFVKYYYNHKAGVCKKFIYGGCEGRNYSKIHFNVTFPSNR
jgi:hypothetical protein